MRILRSKELDGIDTIARAKTHIRDAIVILFLLWLFPVAAAIKSLTDSEVPYRAAVTFLMFTVPVFGTVFGAFRALEGAFLLRRFPEIRSVCVALIVTVVVSTLGLLTMATVTLRG